MNNGIKIYRFGYFHYRLSNGSVPWPWRQGCWGQEEPQIDQDCVHNGRLQAMFTVTNVCMHPAHQAMHKLNFYYTKIEDHQINKLGVKTDHICTVQCLKLIVFDWPID